jgi:murein DD-endopeptidase MepM/ murein hydrolase activator NlpD
MQLWKTVLRIGFFLPAAVPAGVVALVPDTQEASPTLEPLVAGLPPASDGRIWVRLLRSATNEDLADRLSIPEERLAELNAVNEDHRYSRGAWLVLPSQSIESARRVSMLDANRLRHSPPLETPPPAVEASVVRFGDTVFKIAQRYGMTLADLLQLNPGLETARLVVGSPIRLAQSAPVRPKMVLGLRPSGSGGLSWPDLPGFGSDQLPSGEATPSSSGWIWPTQGLFTSGYGWRWGRMHKGIDIANNVGTSVVAARSGRVTFSGWHDGGYGYLVTIQHDDGSRSLYAHNSRLLVREGEDVHQGQSISQMGSTGRSTGPHLHFEIHPPERGAVNPLGFLPPRA